jgi:hypothetical protein
MIRLQTYFFRTHGLFLERKRGEFRYGLDDKVLSKHEIIDRVSMARALTAYSGDPQRARSSQDRIFEEEGFDKLLSGFDDEAVAIAYFSFATLDAGAVSGRLGIPSASMRYGKYAMLFAVSQLATPPSRGTASLPEHAQALVERVLVHWSAFEAESATRTANAKFIASGAFNLDGYYKGATLSDDIKAYPWRDKK